MHPLSIFPQLFFLGLLSPLLLRLAVGVFIISLGITRYQKMRDWSTLVYTITGLLLVIGLYTQIAILIAILILIFDFYTDKSPVHISSEKKILYVIILVVLISLMFTGPGFFAFDLPL
jgi:uncharacterized membrane protein YphA (DoxX/SURF4 family)